MLNLRLYRGERDYVIVRLRSLTRLVFPHAWVWNPYCIGIATVYVVAILGLLLASFLVQYATRVTSLFPAWLPYPPKSKT